MLVCCIFSDISRYRGSVYRDIEISRLFINRVQSYNIFLICANKMLNNIYFLCATTISWTELKIFCQIIYAAAPREAKGSR